MARKRKKLKDLEYTSREYWNKLLSQEGLSLDAGKSEKLLYVGGAPEVDRLKGFLETNNGRVIPPDNGEGSGDDKE